MSPLQRCREKLSKDIAFMDVRVSRAEVPLAQMSQSYSAVDRIAIVGGTLGLWMGFSLSSAVEALYWLFMFAEKRLRGRKKNKD